MLSTLIIIALFVLFIILGSRRGIARTVLNIVGFLLCCSLSKYLASLISDWLYNSFIKDGIIAGIESTFEQSGAQAAIQSALDSLPAWASPIVSFSFSSIGISDATAATSDFFSSTGSAAANAVESAAQPVVTGIICNVIAIVLFIILFIIVKKLVRLIVNLLRIAPVVGRIDRFTGGLFGGIEGIIIVWLLVNLSYSIISAVSPSLFSDSLIIGSLYKALCSSI